MAKLPPLDLQRCDTQISEFGLPNDKFKLVKALSNGGQGEVHVCARISSGEQFAVKIIDKKVLRNSYRSEVLLRREIRTLRELQHRNVVSLLDAFWVEGCCFIIMNLAEQGDLREKVTLHVGLGQDHAGSEHASRHVARQLCSGINYMHRRRVVHRDLKLENILVVNSRPAQGFLCSLYEVQITDFGLSTWLDIVGEEMTPCGTVNYLAPEVMKDNYDDRVDFWSFGVVLYILLCGDFPFAAYQTPSSVARLEGQPIKQTDGWRKVSDHARAFVSGMLAFEPDDRLTHGACLRHPWLASEASGWFEDVEVEADDEGNPAMAQSLSLRAAGAIACISGWTGAALDSLKLKFRSGSIETFGDRGGFTQMRHALNPDEVVVAVQQENRDNCLGNGLTFYTSACNVFEFQGTDARRRRRFVAPTGSQIVGLQFVGSRLTGIHLHQTPETGAQGLVERISGRSGYAVDHLCIVLRTGTVRSYGGEGGFEQGPWALEPNEYFTVVEQAKRDAYLGNSIAFYSSAGRVFKFQGMEASLSRRFVVPTGQQICGIEFSGSSLAAVRVCSAQVSSPAPHAVQRHAVSNDAGCSDN